MSRACTTTTDKKVFALFIVWIVCDESSSEADEEAISCHGQAPFHKASQRWGIPQCMFSTHPSHAMLNINAVRL